MSSIQLGQEETLAFRIMAQLSKKLLLPPDSMPTICSVLGRVSIPGSIFMEALDIKAVYNACKDLQHVRISSINDICKISAQDARLNLREQAMYTPDTPGWVRLTKKPYKGDIAFVFDITPSFVTTLLTVPRISTYLTNEKRKRYNRPPQALFNPETIRAFYGDESVTESFFSYIFKGDTYTEGLL